ncbi:type II toxin-antitoxin system RelE/ParE family toxin [Companilactobacillus nodensis]
MFYFRIVNSKYAIISGFTKKTQKTPVRELNHARKLRDEYLREEDGKNGNY